MKVKEGDKIEVTKFIFYLLKAPTLISTKSGTYVTNPAHIVHVKYDKYTPSIEITMSNGKLVLKLDEGKRLVEVYME